MFAPSPTNSQRPASPTAQYMNDENVRTSEEGIKSKADGQEESKEVEAKARREEAVVRQQRAPPKASMRAPEWRCALAWTSARARRCIV